MTPFGQTFKIHILAAIAAVSVAMTVRGQSFSLYSGTNMIPANAVRLHDEPATGPILPAIGMTNVPLSEGVKRLMREWTNRAPSLIQFDNVPITVALKNLARAGRFNYILGPEIGYGKEDNDGQIIREPAITRLFTNTAPERAFMSICAANRLVVMGNPMTTVFVVGFRIHVQDVTAEIYAKDTNTIPTIQFEEVPLSVALENLAREAGLKFILNPRIDTGDPGSEPRVNMRWENITAAQAFAAICQSYDLDVIRSPVSDYIRVEPND